MGPFRRLLKLAGRQGLWLKAARHEAQARWSGGRYSVTLPHGVQPLFAADDLRTVECWLEQYRG
jgi:hypothetical protein